MAPRACLGRLPRALRKTLDLSLSEKELKESARDKSKDTTDADLVIPSRVPGKTIPDGGRIVAERASHPAPPAAQPALPKLPVGKELLPPGN